MSKHITVVALFTTLLRTDIDYGTFAFSQICYRTDADIIRFLTIKKNERKMELNKEIKDILLEYGMLCQENKWTISQMEIRSTYDTFRIQNIVEKFNISGVVKRYLVKVDDSLGEREGIFNAKTTKQAYKQARKKLNVTGDCEYSHSILD